LIQEFLDNPIAHFHVVSGNSNQSRLDDILSRSEELNPQVKLLFDFLDGLFIVSNRLLHGTKPSTENQRHYFKCGRLLLVENELCHLIAVKLS